MCSSRRRREYRLHTGVDRKSCVTRWMNVTTVGVVISRTKAGEGAERSCPKRRRRRGQRVGVRRSRGGKPPRTVTNSAQTSNVPTERRIKFKLRFLDFWSSRIRTFTERCDSINEALPYMYRSRDWKGDWQVYYSRKYADGRSRWRALSRRIRPLDSLLADTLQCSWQEFVQCRYGRVDPTTDSLNDLVETLRINRYVDSKERGTKGRSRKVRFARSRGPGRVSPLLRVLPEWLMDRYIGLPPQPVEHNRKIGCSSCGRPAFVWRNHRCPGVEATRDQERLKGRGSSSHRRGRGSRGFHS